MNVGALSSQWIQLGNKMNDLLLPTGAWMLVTGIFLRENMLVAQMLIQ